jgi:ElaB/YqjD/DUF883 family membrane-anchored ribosome-binding protein
VEHVDRDTVIGVLAERANISRQEATRKFDKWEADYHQLRQQGEQTLTKARQQAEQALGQARQEAERIQGEAKVKLEQAREDAERKAREVAEATTKMISRLALAGFAAIMIGAVAGGIGGVAGAPGTIPTVEILDSDEDTVDVDVPASSQVTVLTITPDNVPTSTP